MPEMTCSVCGRPAGALDAVGRCPACAPPGIALVQQGPGMGADTVSLESVVAPQPPPPPGLRGPDVLLGREIGGCRLVAKIGGGGMGVVYRAEQLSLNRTVAVKLVRPASNESSDFVARLRSEARVVATLNHPHIVQVHDVGSEDDLYYIVMEYVDGPSLRGLLRESGAPDPATACAWLVQCLLGLAHAHSRGVVHRDLKPDNILVGSSGQVKLADFGLAKLLHAEQHLTTSGVVLGTPLYMSPEAAHGETLDSRADLYSLGATFYHLFSGTPPFTGDTPLAILYRHIHQPVTPLTTVNPRIEPTLAAVVDRLLAKDRSDRFASCEEVLAALGEPLTLPGGLPVSAERNRSALEAAGLPGESRTSLGVRASLEPASVAANRPPQPPRAGQRAPTRRAGRIWLLVPVLVIGAVLLGTSGRKALEAWQNRPDAEGPAPDVARPRAGLEDISSSVLARQAGDAAADTDTPDEAALRARCEAMLGHLARREFLQMLEFISRRFDRPAPPLVLANRVRRALNLPPFEEIREARVESVRVDPSTGEGTTNVTVQLKGSAAVERVDLSLRWKRVDGQWRLDPQTR